MESNKGKTANEFLYEHGIDTSSLNDEFNTQLFNAMERYAETKSPIKDNASDGEISIWINSKIKELGKIHGEFVKVDEYTRAALSLEFKDNCYYTLSISKQSTVTFD